MSWRTEGVAVAVSAMMGTYRQSTVYSEGCGVTCRCPGAPRAWPWLSEP